MKASRTIMSRLSPCLVDLRFGVAPIPRIRSELDVAAGKLPVELDLGSADMMGGMGRMMGGLIPEGINREWPKGSGQQGMGNREYILYQ